MCDCACVHACVCGCVAAALLYGNTIALCEKEKVRMQEIHLLGIVV